MYYFSSDTHFNMDNRKDHDKRPFKTNKAFDRFIIKLWNKQAKKGDTIFLIGDFLDYHDYNKEGWKKALIKVKKFNADIVLIIGNNEERVIKNCFNNNFDSFREYCLSLGFKEVYKNHIVHILDRDFYLVHKLKDCSKSHINLFGHSHRSIGVYTPYGFNVGCDLNYFRLYGEEDIKYLLYMKETFWEKDKNIGMLYNVNVNEVNR